MKKSLLPILLFFLFLATVARISAVNQADYYELFPVRKYYKKNEAMELKKGHYYFTSYDWSGYSVEVTDAQIMNTADFLKEHSAPDGFLMENGYEQTPHHTYDYVCLVKVVFRYDGTDSEEKDPINLMEFKLIGPDYTISAAPELNKLSGFNELLQGNSRFIIKTGKPLEVVIPFFVSTGYETGMSVDYFIRSRPQFLATYYPLEKCGEIFD